MDWPFHFGKYEPRGVINEMLKGYFVIYHITGT